MNIRQTKSTEYIINLLTKIVARNKLKNKTDRKMFATRLATQTTSGAFRNRMIRSQFSFGNMMLMS